MWAQLITMTLKPDIEPDLDGLMEQLHAGEQAESGLVRTTTMRDQQDPSKVYTLVVFESEEKARAREQDLRRKEVLAPVQAMMAQLFDGPPTFVNLTVVYDV